MTAATLYFGHSQPDTPYRDASGRPLAGARLTFWRSGTSAPAPVYDGPLGQELEQPVVADENGVFPDIYLGSTHPYRVRLTDALGRLVWDVDPYLTESITQFVVDAFTAVGAFTWTRPVGVDAVDVLIVGGGGASGATFGTSNTHGPGGGAAGEVKYVEQIPVTGNVSGTVGFGGTFQGTWNGGNSSFGELVAQGGSSGVRRGSGGISHDGSGPYGGGGCVSNVANDPGGIGTLGRNGGNAANALGGWFGGGGGGAGEDGGNAITNVIAVEFARGGKGGDGLYFGDKFGDQYGDGGWFGGGGGGSSGLNSSESLEPAPGGRGGGGHGSYAETNINDVPGGMANTGGGAGGGGNNPGGSGIVLVRYIDPDVPPVPFLSPVIRTSVPGQPLYFVDAADYVTPVAAAYADAELRVPHPNPILPDAGGFYPPIYLDPDVTFVVVHSAPAAWPRPTITAISPTEAEQGGDGFTLTVTGEGFIPASVVRWNGKPRPTTYVSATELTAAIPAGDLAVTLTPSKAKVTVFTPPPGGGVSNAVLFEIESAAPEPVFVIFDQVGEDTWTVPAGVTEVDVLIVAGGGGGYRKDAGALFPGGGGGAGGVLILEDYAVSPESVIALKVGAGGQGGIANDSGTPTSGQDSAFDGQTAIGGGAGGRSGAQSGGSGGGAGSTVFGETPGEGTPGQGHDGGIGTSNTNGHRAGGGGGYSGPGENGGNQTGGGGGPGLDLATTIFAGAIAYGAPPAVGGGGGAGAYRTSGTQIGGAGGFGGGGNGGNGASTSTSGEAGAPNTGGGGGSGGGNSNSSGNGTNGGNGGSGIVIVRYMAAT